MKTANIQQAQGTIGRGVQLLTGSRARALEAQAANRGAVRARHAATGDRIFKEGVFGNTDGRAAEVAFGQNHALGQGARRGQERALRAAATEREAVTAARKDAGKALGGTALGVGGGMAVMGGEPKIASSADPMAQTAVAGSNPNIRAATQKVQQQVAENAKPLLSKTTKLVGGGAALGLGAAAVAHHLHKPAQQHLQQQVPMKMASVNKEAVSAKWIRDRVAGAAKPENIERLKDTVYRANRRMEDPSLVGKAWLNRDELAGAGSDALRRLGVDEHEVQSLKLSAAREQQIKEAFGAALMQGLRGVGQFAQTAGKSVFNAAKSGGMAGAGQAAMNAGRSGMMRAGNFIAQNPGAGAAMVAAPALAAGYAAGRQ